jgi:hypothetical protein
MKRQLRFTPRARRIGRMIGTAALVGLAGGAAHAQFAAAVTPPRFEISVEPGQVTRQVMEITHAIAGTGSYRVYTTDWNMDPSGALTFYDTVQPGSCRPWVSIERREVAVAQGTRVRYRFEVAPPAGVSPQECRFALMIESKPQEVMTSEASSFPMNGRIGVIVYVSVGGAKAVLEPGALTIGRLDGQQVPMLSVHNSGNATGRLSGILEGTDAGGAPIEFTPESLPILPGQTRLIGLQRYAVNARPAVASVSANASPAPAAPAWPRQLRGVLEYGPPGTGKLPLDRPVPERAAQ